MMCDKKFSQTKRVGCCVCCGEETYDAVAYCVDEGSPLHGHPVSVGRQKVSGTLVVFLLSNGSTADISFCLDCAQALTPADYPALWTCCCNRSRLSLQLAERSLNEQKVKDAAFCALWIMARVGKCRESVDPGVLMVDRRG